MSCFKFPGRVAAARRAARQVLLIAAGDRLGVGLALVAARTAVELRPSPPSDRSAWFALGELQPFVQAKGGIVPGESPLLHGGTAVASMRSSRYRNPADRPLNIPAKNPFSQARWAGENGASPATPEPSSQTSCSYAYRLLIEHVLQTFGRVFHHKIAERFIELAAFCTYPEASAQAFAGHPPRPHCGTFPAPISCAPYPPPTKT